MISEGFGQQTDKQFAAYLFTSRGSSKETRTHLQVARGRAYITEAERLKTSRHWVFEMTRKRQRNPIPHYKIGRYLRFNWKEVCDWLETTTWDKASPPPPLPAEVVEKTAAKYREALERLTNQRSDVSGQKSE